MGWFIWRQLSEFYGIFFLSAASSSPAFVCRVGSKHWHFNGAILQTCLYFVGSGMMQVLEHESHLKQQLIMRLTSTPDDRVRKDDPRRSKSHISSEMDLCPPARGASLDRAWLKDCGVTQRKFVWFKPIRNSRLRGIVNDQKVTSLPGNCT